MKVLGLSRPCDVLASTASTHHRDVIIFCRLYSVVGVIPKEGSAGPEPTNPSFGMTTTKTLRSVFSWHVSSVSGPIQIIKSPRWVVWFHQGANTQLPLTDECHQMYYLPALWSMLRRSGISFSSNWTADRVQLADHLDLYSIKEY